MFFKSVFHDIFSRTTHKEFHNETTFLVLFEDNVNLRISLAVINTRSENDIIFNKEKKNVYEKQHKQEESMRYLACLT